MANLTQQQLGDLREKAGQKRVQKSDLPDVCSISTHARGHKNSQSKRRSKYNAVRSVDADGLKWDSKAERARWNVLMLLKQNGTIQNLARQIHFPIIMCGVKCGVYIADFVYERLDEKSNRGFERIVEDCKGFKTSTYRLKKRLVEAQYGITITEVR